MLGRRVERGAWIAGIGLLALYGGSRLWAESERQRGLDQLRGNASVQAEPRAMPEAGVVDQTLWSPERARAFAEASASPGTPVGALLIPSIRLEVPVYTGTTELNLNRGAAHIEGTAALGAPGNAGIAAHRDGFFRALEKLELDAEVIVETDRGKLRYRVADIGIVAPTDVHVLAPTAVPSVTLVTCYPFYFVGNAPERYIVRAELVDPKDGLAFDGDRRTSAPKTMNGGAEQ